MMKRKFWMQKSRMVLLFIWFIISLSNRDSKSRVRLIWVRISRPIVFLSSNRDLIL